jgi:hypothetical protein
MLNRGLVIVSPREPFRQWLLSLPEPINVSLEEMNEDRSAYLITEFDDDKHRERVLQKSFKMIFEDQLVNWWTRNEDWPKKRDLLTFKKWFDLQFHSVVEDLVDDELVDE